MSEINAKQELIVNARDVNLIVSASAGTGKTTTLTKRIIELIERGESLEQMLVVTFTNLAAGEMKQRISKELRSLASNAQIEKTINLIDSYSISTLHSFCSEVLRNYFHTVGIDPSFEIGEESILSQLKNQALNKVLEDNYKDELTMKVFNYLSNRDDNKLKEIILEIYEFTTGVLDVNEWVNSIDDIYDSDYFATVLNDHLCDVTNEIKGNLEELTYVCKQINFIALLDYVASIEQAIRTSKNKSLEQNILELVNVKLPNSSNKYAEFTSTEISQENLELLLATIEANKEQFKAIAKRYKNIPFNAITQANQNKQTLSLVKQLIKLTMEFETTYFNSKQSKGIVDFSDLERLTYKALSNKQVSDEVKAKYKYVFVDEYQDINHLQEAIINFVRSEVNTFYVGDIKQSIYGFRNCQVGIFVDKLRSFSSDNDVSQAHNLSTNYRSTKGVIDVINGIFIRTMTEEFGGVDYIKQQLEAYKTASEEESVRLDLILKGDSASGADEEKNGEDFGQWQDDLLEESNASLEGKHIASRINGLVGQKNVEGKIVKFGDIAILIRSAQVYGDTLYKQLIDANIPVVYDNLQLDLSSIELRTLIQFLTLVDNSLDDLIFASVAKSHIGKISEQQLSNIMVDVDEKANISNIGVNNLINKCQLYLSGHSDEISDKLSALMDLIERYRIMTNSLTVDSLLARLIEETDYINYVNGLPNGAIRIKRVYSLLQTIRGKPYASNLSRFINYMSGNAIKLNNDISDSTNAVKLLTMHKSKGLEYDIVFVAGLSRKFNLTHGSVVLHSQATIGCNYFDEQGFTSVNTLAYLAINQLNANKQLQEELRLLYVALTRARRKLYLSAVVKEVPSTMVCLKCSRNMLDYLMPYFGSDNGNKRYNTVYANEIAKEARTIRPIVYDEAEEQQVEELREQLKYKYPYDDNETPSKVVSSQLDVANTQTPYFNIKLSDASMYGASVGIAYHRIMETYHVNPNETTSTEQIKNHINELLKLQRLDSSVVSSVDVAKLHRCMNNEQYLNLLTQGRVYHEIPFMLKADYGEIVNGEASGKQTVLQGIIDVAVVRGDKATIIDYKYVKSSEFVKTKYRRQLLSYRYAVKQILGIDDAEMYIFSLDDNKLIQL